MPDTPGFIPQEGLFGDIFREAGGVDVRQYADQRAQEEAAQAAAFEAWQSQQADDQATALQAEAEAGFAQSSQEFTDWPTYTQLVQDTPPHMAYDEYVGASLPWQLQQMGYSPEEAQREVQLFMQQVPRPEEDYGFFGNLMESARGGFGSGTRAMQAVGNMAQGDTADLAALAAENAGVQRVGPLQRFQQGIASPESDGFWEAVKNFGSQSWENPEGALNFITEQLTQSYPVMAAGLGGFMAGSAVPVVGNLIGGAVGLGAGSGSLDAGLGMLDRIATAARERGVDLNDKAAVSAMLQEGGLYEDLRNTAVARGATVGAVDGMISAFTMGAGTLATRAAQAGRRLPAAGYVAGGLAGETAGAGVGEYAGQVVAGDPTNWADVVAEMGGELGPGVAGLGMGALRSRNPLIRPPEPGFDEGDLAAFGEPEAPPLGLPYRPGMEDRSGDVQNEEQRMASAAIQARADAIYAARDAAEAALAEINTPYQGGIDVTEAGPVEEIELTGNNVGIAGLLPAPGELAARPAPPLYVNTNGDVVTDPGVLDRAAEEARIAALAPQIGNVDVTSVESMLDRMVARGIDVSADEMQLAMETIVAAPVADKQAAIADVILGLGTSTNPNAEAVSLELIRIARTLRPDRQPATPQQAQASIQQLSTELGVAPEAVMPTIAQALAEEIVNATTPQPTTSQPAVTAPAATRQPAGIESITRTRRSLKSGESVPAPGLGSLIGQLGVGGPVEGASSADQTQGQPGGGLRSGVAAQGTQPRGLRRGSAGTAAANPGSNRVEPNRAGSDPVVPGRGLKKLKPYSGEIAEAEGKKGGVQIDEYGNKYVGRDLDLDMAAVIDIDRAQGNLDPLSPGLVRTLQMSNADGVLSYLGSVMSNPLARMIANNMRETPLNVQFEVKPGLVNSKGQPVNGNYSLFPDGSIVVSIDPNRASMETVLHELVHAAVASVVANPTTPQQIANVEHLNNLFMYVKDKLPNSSQYGLRNLQEFVAEAMSNETFQKDLAAIPVKSKFGLRNALDVFKRLVLRLLGLDKSTNALSEAVMTVQELFGQSKTDGLSLDQQSQQVLNAYAATPSNAILGDRNGARTFIAYPTKPGDQSTAYTLYPVTSNPRGDAAGKIPKLSRKQVEDYIANAGSQVIAPKAEISPSSKTPKETGKQLVGYNREGMLTNIAFEQKDGTWTFYDSPIDVRRDPNAKVMKGLTKAQVERTLSAKGTTTAPPKKNAVQTSSGTPTSIGYSPGKKLPFSNRTTTDMLTTFRSRNQAVYSLLEQAEDQGVNIPRDGRIDERMVLSNSDAQRKVAEMSDTYIEPVRKAGAEIMRQFSKTQAQIEDALLQLHNVERQQVKIRQIQNSKGFTDVEKATRVTKANAKIASAQAKIQAYNSAQPQFIPTVKSLLAPKMKALADNNLDTRVQYQLETREAVESKKAAYDFYVPIQTGDRTTQGKAATGESTEADLSFARLQEQATRSILQGEQNLIRIEMANLARKYGITIAGTNQPLVEIGGAPIVRYDKETNSLEPGVDSFMFDENSIPFFEMGVRQYMRVNDPNMQKAMQKYTGVEKDSVIAGMIGAAAKTNHIISIGKTALSPVFPLFNVLRDIGMTMLNKYPGVTYASTAKHLANPMTWIQAFSNTFKEAGGGKMSGDFKRFADLGGTIDQKAYIGLDTVVQSGQGEFISSPKSILKKGGNGAFGLLAGWAQSIESGTRYAVFKAAKDAGLSDRQAAVAAKTTTLNFEERGTLRISPYYIFGNAKVQGLYNMYKILERMGGPQAALFSSGVVGVGLMAGYIAYQNSDDDKDGKKKFLKVPNYKKDTMVLFSEGKWAGVPFPQELQPMYVFGNAIADGVWGGATVGEVTSRIATSWLNTAWPGNVPQQELAGHKASPTEFFLRAVVPSWGTPVVDLATNNTTFGSELVAGKKEKAAKGIPLRDMGTANTNQKFVSAAQGLGDLTGGYIDVAPQQLQHLNAYFNPFAESTAFFRDLFGGREVKYEGDVVNPVVRKFSANATPFYDQDKFDELLAQAKQAKYQAEQRGITNLSTDEQVLAKSAAMLERVKSDSNSLFKGLKGGDVERRRMLNDRSRELLLGGIRRYNELRDQTRGK